ncbi:hypothetical protein [Rhodoferax aquaticus]|uniref:Uncharacterized protein n=1 Tax=Rhodoferax aquaticus TaxID=2527691 RepID=A0A515EV30_9BURK|nr:hypothetical protein [Rhodoferax aquaticus]QDL56532.1 hypothetical protein EXZ61_21550 [Rhodoferax aquaticus]
MLSHTQTAPRAAARSEKASRSAVPAQATPAATAQPLWRQTCLVDNRYGREEAFTIGPDGCVWSFFPDALAQAFDVSYCLESLGMPADVLAVGKDEFGNLVAVAAKGLQVQYRVELPHAQGAQAPAAAARWSEVRHANLPAMPGAIAIERLYTQDVFGSHHIAAMVRMDASVDESTVRLLYCNWTEQNPEFFASNEARELGQLARIQNAH